MPLPSELSSICKKCLEQTPPFSKVITYGIYEGVLAVAINHLKFYGVRRISKPLGKLMSNLALPFVDGVVPVPLHIKKLRERGFNQSLIIARPLSKSLRIPLLMDVLIKIKETPPQIGLSAKDRISNMKNAFSVHGDVKDMRILLVDDVMTTGATVTSCSSALMKAGAREVFVLALARSRIM